MFWKINEIAVHCVTLRLHKAMIPNINIWVVTPTGLLANLVHEADHAETDNVEHEKLLLECQNTLGFYRQ